MHPLQHPSTSSLPEVAAQVVVPVSKSGASDAEQKCVAVRLGVYTGLFYALRAKHPPTAAHALRVSIGCSKWCAWRSITGPTRDLIEIAGLVHDIGKIGVPDRVLQKPTQLTGQEQLMMEMQHAVGEEMLRAAGGSDDLRSIVRQAREQYAANGETISLAAQMLAIVDAFDSMTTEQVFRRALSRERALEELFAHAGTQFNPELVKDFAYLVGQPRPDLEAEVAQRWLCELAPNLTPGFLDSTLPPSCGAIQNLLDTLFHHRLLARLKDAAVYLDAEHQILSWNQAAEQLTGRQAAAVLHRRWTPELMHLRNEAGKALGSNPLEETTNTHAELNARMRVCPGGKEGPLVQFSAIPVFTGQQEFAGSIVMLRDASTEAILEQRVQSLHEIAIQDPLTKVANRAELNRRLPDLFEQYERNGSPGSLIICDIDYFKKINDTFGHQAGDEALVTFAGVLRENARHGDLVARYGGEEFVILCANCDNPTATARAVQMRQAIQQTPVPALKKRPLTASFGVTEIQSGDDAETLLARADRALLMAKESGRNCVIQLGAGQSKSEPVEGSGMEHADASFAQNAEEPAKPIRRTGWLAWFTGSGEPITSAEYLVSVPQGVAIQKLRGFISDHQAELTLIDNTRVAIRVDGRNKPDSWRGGERPAVMLLDVCIQDVEVCCSGRQQAYLKRTKIAVSVKPLRARDRRSDALRGQAQRLLASFQAYLVAQRITEEMRPLIMESR